ncbi:MAG: hypothetical protein RIC56_07485 [Pseudomonadales bacterium]
MIGRILRWMLVPVTAVAVVALAVVGSRWAVSIVDGRCPVDRMVGGACVEPWHTGAVETAIYGGVAFGAFGLVLFPALVAPNLKRTVAVVGLLLGIGGAAGFYLMTRWEVLLAPLAVAAASGALALWRTWTRRATREAR